MRDRQVSGGRVRELRVQAAISRTELARRTGVSVSFLKYVETGEQQPSDVYASLIADGLGCSVEAFSEPKQQQAVAS